jgi:uncharacterized protein (TIGR02452 family)
MNLKEKRVGIFFDTVKIVKNGSYRISGNDYVMVSSTASPSQFFENKIDIEFDKLPTYEEKISVEEMDCLLMAERELKNGGNVAVLNMASPSLPGGGVLKGSGAQEENLFRRSSLFNSLYQFKRQLANEFDIEPSPNQYPLNENYGGIYSPNVAVFRGTEDEDYPLLPTPFKINVVTVAACKNPQLTADGKLSNDAKEKTINKIETILNICLINGIDTIILSAFGCGAFSTPPNEMALAFKEVLTSENYKNKFKFVGFAIIDDHNAHREHNPEGNFIPFKRVFENN